jgi:hypothetical protein
MNRLNNLRAFLRHWDMPLMQSLVEEDVTFSASGNINMAGSSLNGAPSHTLTAKDPRFYEFIEGGVRALVKALIEKFDCITYSSCEGHPGVPGQSVFEPRHVGIIPRDYDEYMVLHKALIYLTARVNAYLCWPTSHHDVYIVTRIEPIESDDGPALYGLDLYFYMLGDDEQKYFAEVDAATALLTQYVEEHELAESDETLK